LLKQIHYFAIANKDDENKNSLQAIKNVGDNESPNDQKDAKLLQLSM